MGSEMCIRDSFRAIWAQTRPLVTMRKSGIFFGSKRSLFGDFWGSVAGALGADIDPLSYAKFVHDSILKVVSGFPAPRGAPLDPNSASCKSRKIGNFFSGGQKIDFWGFFGILGWRSQS